jgi:NADP-dependent 3-hydroxy acid dehydrogenase YdfG
MLNKWALITGASSGIGEASARRLAKEGYNLYLIARRKEKLNSLSLELLKNHSIEVVWSAVDICDRVKLKYEMDQHKSILERLDVLINNAGLARGVEKIQEAHIEDWDAMVDTNVKALLYVTRFVLPFMVQRKKGHIVNIGSIAGRWVYSGGGVYCATKFAVRALTEGLRQDLLGTGIRVTNIEPGMVETEFSEVRLQDKNKAKQVYQGMTPLVASDIAETIYWCLSRPSHINIQELVVFPTDQAAIQLVHRT